MPMSAITEAEFGKIVEGILADRASIIKHNPIGSDSETLLWMLLSCLVTYMSLDDNETPCFTGRPDEETYKTAIRFILNGRRDPDFDAEPYLDKLTQQ